MEKEFDEKLKGDLIRAAKPLPVSYTERIEILLKNLPNRKREQAVKFHFRYVAAAVGISLVLASGAHAAVNMYQKYLQSMGEAEKEQLNEKTQRETENSDHFSRDLSEEERKKIETLQKDYEKKGVFPQEKIMEIDGKADVMEGELAFCYEDSMFYLPDRELTEEEMLKIIDFWERRDYAVKEENAEKQIPEEEQTVSREKAVKIAKEALQKAYKLDTSDAKSSIELNTAELSEGESLPSYFITLSNAFWEYDACIEVDADSGLINQIKISHKTKEECVSGIKVRERRYKAYSEQIYHMLPAIGENEDDIEEMRFIYRYCEDGTLNRGNVKYLVKWKNGSVCVFLYSINTQMIYHVYKMDDYSYALMLEERSGKQHKQKKILTKSKVIVK